MTDKCESDTATLIDALRPFARAIPREHWRDWVDYSRPLKGHQLFDPPRLSDYRRACELVEKFDQEHRMEQTG